MIILKERDMALVRDIVVPKGQMFGSACAATLTPYRKNPSAFATDRLHQPLDLNSLPIDPPQVAGKATVFVTSEDKMNAGVR